MTNVQIKAAAEAHAATYGPEGSQDYIMALHHFNVTAEWFAASQLGGGGYSREQVRELLQKAQLRDWHPGRSNEEGSYTPTYSVEELLEELPLKQAPDHSREFRRCLKNMFREEVGSNGWEYDYYRAKELFDPSLPVAPQPDHIGDLNEMIAPQPSRHWSDANMIKLYNGLLQNVGTCIKQSDLPTAEQYLQHLRLFAAPQPEAETVEQSGREFYFAIAYEAAAKAGASEGERLEIAAKVVSELPATPQHPNRDVVEVLRGDGSFLPLDMLSGIVNSFEAEHDFSKDIDPESTRSIIEQAKRTLATLRALSATRSEASNNNPEKK